MFFEHMQSFFLGKADALGSFSSLMAGVGGNCFERARVLVYSRWLRAAFCFGVFAFAPVWFPHEEGEFI